MDTMTPEQRHRCMAAIKARNTRPELVVRRYLHARGFRYRLNHKRLPGKPDLVLRKYRTCIFVNGCFWHGHDCSMFKLPQTRTDYWLAKINRNRERDTQTNLQLARMRWHVITLWECQLRPAVRQQTLESLAFTLNRIYLERLQLKTPTVHSDINRQFSILFPSTENRTSTQIPNTDVSYTDIVKLPEEHDIAAEPAPDQE